MVGWQCKRGSKNNYFSQRNVMEMEELLIKSNKSKNLKGVGGAERR